MKYLKPFNFYNEIFKDILMKKAWKHGRLLGLNVDDKYVSLAVSDYKNINAVPLGGLHRQENNMSSMADIFQSLISEHNLVGFVVGSPYMTCRESRPLPAEGKEFIDDLCKIVKVEGLKYTFWDGGITSKNSDFVLNQYVEFMSEHLPQDMSPTIMHKYYAVSVLQGYLDATNRMRTEECD
ncbi:hypothetical protein EZV62_025337 [Acer yangbiense]|uniref:YqgF/RNase H-like domain-containing protein n=1 Tax=Acer yangbiense TaxID=1000413 RepID=A0A5C7GYR2_9ROSI|nr:hypothetical protein EZV62_025337 [Acer yangbiense]